MTSFEDSIRPAAKTDGPVDRLATLIRARAGDIVADWRARIRDLPHARGLDDAALTNSIPELLDRIAALAETTRGEPAAASLLPGRTAARHALERLEQGFDLREVIAEVHRLRQSIFSVWERSGGVATLAELCVLDHAIDLAVAASADEYASVRDRSLVGLDKVAAAAFETDCVDELLRRLLGALVEMTPAIDTSAIVMYEPDAGSGADSLRVRASVGEPPLETVVAVQLDADVVGRVAARRRPITIYPLDSEVRVVHGVPIAAGDHLLGVAAMGSLTAAEFSRQDEHIFAAMAARAGAAISQHELRDRAVRTTAQLAERERQMHALADNIPQLAWIADAGGQIVWFNRRWFDYTGARCDEANGVGWLCAHHSDHVERVATGFRNAIAAGEPWEDTVRLRGRDGCYRWFLSCAVPLRDDAGRLDRWFGTHTDVTAARCLDEVTTVLGRSLGYRETLESLARVAVPDLADWCIVDVLDATESAGIAIAHTDPDRLDHVRACAPQCRRAIGVHEVIRTGTPAFATEVGDDLRELGVASWIAAPLVAGERTIGAITMIMDRSNRRYRPGDIAVAGELGRRAGVAVDNARLYREAQDAVRVREALLATVSHDLRNPLGAIDVTASMLLQSHGGDAQVHRQLTAMRRAVERMARLIDDLLDMASLDAGRLVLDSTDEDVRDIVDEAVAQFADLASKRGIRLVVDGELERVMLSCDRDRIGRVFANLIGNALKFCRDGNTVRIRATRSGDTLNIAIGDDGPGIPRDQVEHVFEPYWFAHRQRSQRGIGLGLFISKGLVEAHGGRLEVESEEGCGATFTITLPIDGDRLHGDRALASRA